MLLAELQFVENRLNAATFVLFVLILHIIFLMFVLQTKKRQHLRP